MKVLLFPSLSNTENKRNSISVALPHIYYSLDTWRPFSHAAKIIIGLEKKFNQSLVFQHCNTTSSVTL